MLVKFLNSDSAVSTAIAGTYFRGDGWTGAYYDSGTGQLVFESEDGLGFTTGDLRVTTGGTFSTEWTDILNKPTEFTPSAHTHLWANITDKPTEFTPSAHTHLWADISDKPTEFTPVSHNHTISEVTDLQSVIDDKADKTQILTQQQFKDSVAAMFQGGTHTNVSINYNSVAGTIDLSAAGGGGASVDEEQVQDWVGNLITQGTGISVNYNDAGNVLSIALSGVSFTSVDKSKLDGIAANATANSTDSQLRQRSTHTGTQPISTVSGLQTALDGKAPTSHTHTIANVTNLQTTLDGKAPTSHGHAIADVSGLQTALDGKQPTTSFKTVNGTVITGTGDIVIPKGEDGTPVVITVVNTQAAFDSATPAQNELVVRIA